MNGFNLIGPKNDIEFNENGDLVVRPLAIPTDRVPEFAAWLNEELKRRAAQKGER